jgi:hypothetical protein
MLTSANSSKGNATMSLSAWWRLFCLFLVVVMVVGLVLVPVVASARSEPAPAGKASSVRVYLVAIGDNGKSGAKIGCGDSIVGVTRTVPSTQAPLTAALRLTLANHERYHGQSGLYNALYQSRLALKRVAVVRGTATVRLTGTLRLGGVCDAPRVRAQLRQAAFQFRTVHRVAIFVNGVPLSRALSSR